MAANPVTPIQSIQLTQKDLQDPSVGILNSYLQQITNAVNAHAGANGPTVLPAGVDVAGGTITGLAPPTAPTDAVSASHAASTYSAAAVGPQLDIGGKFTLKGLAILWLNARKFADAEVPGGLINSSNTAYTLAHKPDPQLSLNLFLNGVRQVQGQGMQYTLSGAAITFVTPPPTGQSLIACYRYSS